ncbi:hypothetical protein SCB49_11352 [unidentified eubacterium SCB49]|nr:hypothetical protein SCB49_11352 [unidentified eubacterium SCB49]
MKQHKDIRVKISAGLLLLLFMLPIFTQLSHAFSHHDHPVCTDTSIHIHKPEKDCSISDFQFTAFHFNLFNYTIPYEVKKITSLPSHYKALTAVETSYNYLLRGPPGFQQFI